MKDIRKISLPAIAILALLGTADARENVNANGNRNSNGNRYESGADVLATCTPASAKTDLDVNNVRTTILTGGDMWWDLTNARYEIPKGSGTHSIFAGALWIGGLDAGGSLRVAAMTYRETGSDFWPGPLDLNSASVEGTVCNEYDKHWKISRQEVEDFLAWRLNPNDYPAYTVPLTIQNWPGNGNADQDHFLAPFYDANGDTWYDYMDGDYPGYDLNGTGSCTHNQLYGDQTLWWVFNDRGNIHSETGATAIGIEVHAQAFGFETNDEINNMTFYSYKIINRSTTQLNQTYFGQWTDADLGDAFDDFVGCDVARGLGYTYNGDANDGSSPQGGAGTYGANPPAIGMDFFEGPVADSGDGIDNNRNGTVDEADEQIIMSKFVYYNNGSGVQGNPDNATHYYNYLRGLWKDGTPLTYGGNAYGGTTPSDFMFPGNSDPTFWCTNGIPQTPFPWDETASGNLPDDRRMLQSAGPFTLQPGAINYITVGAVWARASSGGPMASVELMRTIDDKAQRLFDNCFRTLDGPTAPDLTIQELDKEVVVYITNPQNSNNYLERYEAIDPSIVYSTLHPALANIDQTYNFEGYQLFQLKDATVTTADLYDPDRARLIGQCDIQNGVAQLVNSEFDQNLQMDVPMDMTINSDDKGIVHSFSVKTDAFAAGDNRLINHKTYYYLVLAYAYNRYLEYDDVTFDPLSPLAPSNIGQKKPYLAGRKNVKVYSAIPHITSPEAYGTDQPSSYGVGPKLTRIEGCGNGNNILELTQATEDAIVAATSVNNGGTSRVDQIQYEGGAGPVNIKVIDPLNVPEGDFTIQLLENPAAQTTVVSTSTWLLNQTSGVGSPRSWTSDTAINFHSVYANEQIIPEIGMSVTWSQTQNPGLGNNPDRNGYLASSMTFSDPTKDFLTGIVDDESNTEYNWIRGGSQSAAGTCIQEFNDRFSGINAIDANGDYEKLVDGRWAPYRLAAYNPYPGQATICYPAGPAWYPTPAVATVQNRFENISNVDIVLTNDRSKWTRVPVLEVGATYLLNEGQREPWHLRDHASVDKYGRTGDGVVSSDPNDADYIAANGMGWFPGYAINLETGERLNMAFGENSGLAADNGRDMLFNPNARDQVDGNTIWGGMHFVYVFGHNGNTRYTTGTLMNELKDIPAYDCGQAAYKILNADATANTELREVYADAMWTSIPILDSEFQDWNWGSKYAAAEVIPSEVKIRLRVAKPYKRFFNGITAANGLMQSDSSQVPQNMNNPMYAFNTADLKTTTSDHLSALEALDLINVVPNPYYAYSGYEKNQFDNRIKFTNLPVKCEVKIYTINGTLVRKLTKDSPQTHLDWDLKNQAGIPVASGLYIIHVNVEGVGERILKWFGVMRPVDLDSY